MANSPQRPLALRIVIWLTKAVAICVASLALLMGLWLWSQTEWVIDARRARIKSEAASLAPSHPWAGTYYRGDGTGCNELLSISPREGFQFTNHGCCGLMSDAHGRVEGTWTHVSLSGSWLGLPYELLGGYEVVNWGAQRYLIEPKQMLEFVNAFNQLSEIGAEYGFRPGLSGRFYARVGDETVPPQDLPTLPAEFARLLRIARIEGQVIAVTGDVVDLDIGLDHGVFPGMEMYLTHESPSGFGTVELTDVHERSSRGRVNYMDSFSSPVTIGWEAESKLGH